MYFRDQLRKTVRGYVTIILTALFLLLSWMFFVIHIAEIQKETVPLAEIKE